MNKQIKECIDICPFYGRSMDGMECHHPVFEGKGGYENMIISQSDRGGFPEKCPLRSRDITITYTIYPSNIPLKGRH